MSKDRKLPKDLVILDKEPVQVKNPYSGESVTLPPDAVAVYGLTGLLSTNLMPIWFYWTEHDKRNMGRRPSRR